MTLIPTSSNIEIQPIIGTYEQAQLFKTNTVWNALDRITVEEAIGTWLGTLSPLTQINYNSGMKKLTEQGLINPLMSLQAFALVNHESIVDQIKLVQGWSEATKQARAACYVSFTAYLSRRLQGVVRKAVPSKEKGSKTFFKIREKVETEAMNQAQWLVFLKELEIINARDCLIAKIILQGGKRVGEVLSLQTHQIDWIRNEITFFQSKTKGCIKETVITYPGSVMETLKDYLGDRNGTVFITRSGKPVMLNQLALTFEKAGKKANIPFKVTPHVLRATTVTYLKQQGFSDSDIMRVTGHASSALVYAYDKGSRADNASKKVNLVC
jgi:integrase/recombinase XerD